MPGEPNSTIDLLDNVEPVVASQKSSGSVLAEAARTTRGRVGLLLLVFIILVAVVGPFVTPDQPKEFVTQPFAAPSPGHLLGGDQLGRDVLSRLLAGGWELLLVSLIATVLGVLGGALIGIVAATEGKGTDSFLMRTMDVLLAFPQLVFALLLVSVVGPKVWLLVIAVALIHMPAVARVIRAASQDLAEREFVRYGYLIGLSRRKTITGELLPNLSSPLMVESGLRLTYSILVLTSLSFLGFGLQPPAPNWGTMINENRVGLTSNPWGVLAPILMLVILTVGTNLFTDVIAQASLRTASPTRKRKRGKAVDHTSTEEAVA
jgi:peptide/nickel transport system permease protein